MIRYITTSILLTALAVFVLSRCAREMTTLTGGPQDTIPPVVVESEPPNYSVHFDSKSVEVEFNEFIQLNDLQQQFLSSPPFEEDPEVKMKGKGIEIELKEPLRDSTTYTLNFGNAIVDYTEGNPLRNFKYVFSTGDALDSMQVMGRVYDAFTVKARENVLVMLYDELRDSVPYRQIPDYVSRTDEEGYYSITNVRMDTFKLFALDDLNNNYLYDSPDEDIAFIDSLVIFEQERIEEHDTLYTKENGQVPVDTAGRPLASAIDTIIHREYLGYPPENYQLALFNEDNREQYLKSFQRDIPMKVDFVFNKPVGDSLRIDPVDSIETDDWYLQEASRLRDTMTYWLKDTSLYHQEYITVTVDYQKKDSLYNMVWTTDTLDLSYIFEEGEREKQDTLQLGSNLDKTFDLNRDIRLKHPYPIASIDTGGIVLNEMEGDSITGQAPFRLHKPEWPLNVFSMKIKWKPDARYRLQILPQTVKSMYEAYHDTLTYSFKTRPEDYYGSLKVNLSGIDTTFILQVIKPSGDEETVIREQYPEDIRDGVISFNYLHPEEYLVKLIYDENGNRKWDTGDYPNHRQPEKVRYNPEKVNIRSNWEYEIEWDVGNKKSNTENGKE